VGERPLRLPRPWVDVVPETRTQTDPPEGRIKAPGGAVIGERSAQRGGKQEVKEEGWVICGFVAKRTEAKRGKGATIRKSNGERRKDIQSHLPEGGEERLLLKKKKIRGERNRVELQPAGRSAIRKEVRVAQAK